MRIWMIPLLLLAAGCGAPSLLITPVANPQVLEEHTLAPGKGYFAGKIALIEVEGVLMNAHERGLLKAGENKVSLFDQQLAAAAGDSGVKAVVLRINSPGGTVTASDTMYEIIQRFKRETGKPVIAAAQEVAASGGYYIACAADKIVAHPTSIVGSIGVIFHTLNIQGTMDKLGIKTEAIKSAPMKDMGSPFRPLDDESRKVMKGLIDEFYARFVNVVKTHRHLTDDATIALVTDGRVFSGAQAQQLGLVDKTGLLEDAIDLARSMAKAPDAKVIGYRRPFGFTGSIYADSGDLQPQSSVITLDIPEPLKLSAGFYYLWRP